MSAPEREPFHAEVRRCFGQQAGAYERGARLQAGIATRLGQLSRRLQHDLPAGPRADLGAGSGLLSRAIAAGLGGAALLRVDHCSALLEQERGRDPGIPQLEWDLNQGLPAQLQGAALLASSFALQWLAEPSLQLAHWCGALQPGGALLLAVPCGGSFRLWHRAAQQAAVPCTALELPVAATLIASAAVHLDLEVNQLLRFSRPNHGARPFLGQIKAIGAQASRHQHLSAGQLRRLIQHWPGPEQAIVWEVLLLMGRKR
jgi:malonyl-CoA O-methyltransferase